MGVDVSGPLFDGRADKAVDDFLVDARHDVGGQGLAYVHTILDRWIREPTPYYETQLIVEDVAADTVVHDREIIYGPWLEGIGKKNRTTRFKGYHAFRLATQLLNRGRARALAERALTQHLPEMN